MDIKKLLIYVVVIGIFGGGGYFYYANPSKIIGAISGIINAAEWGSVDIGGDSAPLRVPSFASEEIWGFGSTQNEEDEGPVTYFAVTHEGESSLAAVPEKLSEFKGKIHIRCTQGGKLQPMFSYENSEQNWSSKSSRKANAAFNPTGKKVQFVLRPGTKYGFPRGFLMDGVSLEDIKSNFFIFLEIPIKYKNTKKLSFKFGLKGARRHIDAVTKQCVGGA